MSYLFENKYLFENIYIPFSKVFQIFKHKYFKFVNQKYKYLKKIKYPMSAGNIYDF